MFKKIIQKRLENYVRRYFKKHPEVKLVVVAGSVGKTSTKQAIATLLSQKYRVAMDEENHNTEMSVPTSILGIRYPENIKSISAWLKVFSAAKKRIKWPTGTDVIVQELGADHPGDIAHFGTYLHPSIAVITGVTPEHMEFFGDIHTVAKEELEAANFSQQAIINRDDIDGIFAEYLTNSNITTYGSTGVAEHRFEIEDFSLHTGYTGHVIAPGLEIPLAATLNVIGEHSLRPIMGAVAVALQLGLTPDEISRGLAEIRAVPGRMNVLRGANDSTIIDDSYNSSPAAASAALQALYGVEAPQRIALLGSMNELGSSSQAEHEKLGALCDPGLLAWVITVGDEAEQWLAPIARQRGNQVKSFKSALEAGAFVHSVIEQDAVVLVKGSQNKGYLEEAIKIFMYGSAQDRKLVRQSLPWLEEKQKYFNELSSIN